MGEGKKNLLYIHIPSRNGGFCKLSLQSRPPSLCSLCFLHKLSLSLFLTNGCGMLSPWRSSCRRMKAGCDRRSFISVRWHLSELLRLLCLRRGSPPAVWESCSTSSVLRVLLSLCCRSEKLSTPAVSFDSLCAFITLWNSIKPELSADFPFVWLLDSPADRFPSVDSLREK